MTVPPPNTYKRPFEFISHTNTLTVNGTKCHGDHYINDAPEGYIIRHQDHELQDAFNVFRTYKGGIRSFSKNGFGVDEPFSLPYVICVLKVLRRHDLMLGRERELNDAIDDLIGRLTKLMPRIRDTNRQRLCRLSLMFDRWMIYSDEQHGVLYDFDIHPESVTVYIRREDYVEDILRWENGELELCWSFSQDAWYSTSWDKFYY